VQVKEHKTKVDLTPYTQTHVFEFDDTFFEVLFISLRASHVARRTLTLVSLRLGGDHGRHLHARVRKLSGQLLWRRHLDLLLLRANRVGENVHAVRRRGRQGRSGRRRRRRESRERRRGAGEARPPRLSMSSMNSVRPQIRFREGRRSLSHGRRGHFRASSRPYLRPLPRRLHVRNLRCGVMIRPTKPPTLSLSLCFHP